MKWTREWPRDTHSTSRIRALAREIMAQQVSCKIQAIMVGNKPLSWPFILDIHLDIQI